MSVRDILSIVDTFTMIQKIVNSSLGEEFVAFDTFGRERGFAPNEGIER